MFNSKLKTLDNSATIDKKKTSENINPFVKTGLKRAAETRSGNDALKYNTTGNPFVDQFGSLGVYKQPRPYDEINRDMIILSGTSLYMTIIFTFYIRMITRIVQLFDFKTATVQRGAGLKHEGIMRMIWIAINYKEIFWKNINLFIAIGSWKDIFTMLQYDLIYNGWDNRVLDWDKFGKLISAGLDNENSVNLVKKYLPQIKARSRCTTVESQADTMIGKWLCSILFTRDDKSYETYRKLKVSGTAHSWQQLISKRRFLNINFDTIHGKALSLLVSSKFLKNQGLEQKYEKWISSKPVAKFTGYVYELANKIKPGIKKYQIDTINAQYRQLLEKAGKTPLNIIVVKDTSLSMDAQAIGTNMTSYNIAKSLSIFFGNMLSGRFKNLYIDFSSKAILREIKGQNFYEHWITETRLASANTSFESIAHLFTQIRKYDEIPEDQFPTGLLCISDGEFDAIKDKLVTNIDHFKNILLIGGFSSKFISNLKFILWDIRNTFYSRNSKTKFETYDLAKNVFYFSGFDGSVMSFLTGDPKRQTKEPTNAEELFHNAMNQEILNMIEI